MNCRGKITRVREIDQRVAYVSLLSCSWWFMYRVHCWYAVNILGWPLWY